METQKRFPQGLGNLAQHARFPHFHSRSSCLKKDEKKRREDRGMRPVTINSGRGFVVSSAPSGPARIIVANRQKSLMSIRRDHEGRPSARPAPARRIGVGVSRDCADRSPVGVSAGRPEGRVRHYVKGATSIDGRFPRLVVARGKAKPKVATAIARELTGFIWAIAREVRPAQA